MIEQEDEGHVALMNDLDSLRQLADNYEFHDFKNTSFATPKVELHQRLIDMASNVKSGVYDNKPNA